MTDLSILAMETTSYPQKMTTRHACFLDAGELNSITFSCSSLYSIIIDVDEYESDVFSRLSGRWDERIRSHSLSTAMRIVKIEMTQFISGGISPFRFHLGRHRGKCCKAFLTWERSMRTQPSRRLWSGTGQGALRTKVGFSSEWHISTITCIRGRNLYVPTLMPQASFEMVDPRPFRSVA